MTYGPHDEYSTADLRQTLASIAEVAVARRWWFLLAFSAAATLAFAATLWLPRKYAISTSFERRRDVVLANTGRGWPEALETVRATMSDDLASPRLWSEAAAAVPEADGIDTGRILSGLDVSVKQGQNGRDVVTLTVTTSDPRGVPALLRRVRQDYIADATRRTSAVLTEARQFYEEQVLRCRAMLKRAQEPADELARRFPSVTRDGARQLATELARLRHEADELRVFAGDVGDRIALIEGRIESLRAPAAAPLPQSPEPAPPPMMQNPRVALLSADLAKAEAELRDALGVRGMTEQHPTVVAVRERIAQIRSSLESEPAAIPAPMYAGSPLPVAAASPIPPRDPAADLCHQADELRRERERGRRRLAELEERIAALTAEQTASDEQRATWAALSAQADAARSELKSWEDQLEPIDRVLTIQQGRRGVLLRPLDEPTRPRRPISPRPNTLFVACLMLSLAVGAGAALLAEFADHSLRNPAQLAGLLSVPVLGSVDEIVSEPLRRRRFRRRMIVMPLLLGLAAAAVVTSGGLAWLSLTEPQVFERIRVRGATVTQADDGATPANVG